MFPVLSTQRQSFVAVESSTLRLIHTQEHRDNKRFWWWVGCGASFSSSVVSLVASFHEMRMENICEKMFKCFGRQGRGDGRRGQRARGIGKRNMGFRDD